MVLGVVGTIHMVYDCSLLRIAMIADPLMLSLVATATRMAAAVVVGMMTRLGMEARSPGAMAATTQQPLVA